MAPGAEFPFETGQRLIVAAIDDHMRAGLSQGRGHGTAEMAACRGNKRHPAVETEKLLEIHGARHQAGSPRG